MAERVKFPERRRKWNFFVKMHLHIRPLLTTKFRLILFHGVELTNCSVECLIMDKIVSSKKGKNPRKIGINSY